MHDACQMRVVEVEAVDQDAVRERRVAQWQPLAPTDQAGFARAAERRETGDGRVRKRIGVRGKAAPEGVENEELGPLAHALRGGVERQFGRKGGKLPRGLRAPRRRPDALWLGHAS